jgi:hypothetical protein
MDLYDATEQAFKNGYESGYAAGRWSVGVDAISVSDIEAYLQARLDEWNALGDRKWEPANMWGYNFIMACFDDLERRGKNG